MENHVLVSHQPPRLDTSSKEDYINYFKNTYQLYNTLFRTVKSDEAYIYVPDPLRRPLIFYLGHTAVVYMNKLKLQGLVTEPVNSFFEKIFAVGVDPILPEELDNDLYKERLPKPKETWEYREQVYNLILNIFENLPFQSPVTQGSPWWCLCMGCEHERIHVETSTLLLRQMPLEMLQKPKDWKYAPYSTTDFPKNEFVKVQSQQVKLGKDQSVPTFGWDNEYGGLKIDVESFSATQYLISNGEYLEFFNSGEYENQNHWTQEGWDWKNRSNIKNPLFWVKTENGYKYRAIFDVIDMPLDWPVDVSYHEARAYCHWKGPLYRMPREAEWQCMRGENLLTDPERPIDIGAFSKPEENHGNTNMKFGSSSAVNAHRQSPSGFYDTYGNVWEWSEDHFRPLDGFNPDKLYWDFSGGCFDQYHQMMLGSSWASTGLSSSSFIRLAFRRHFYQNVGFRLVKTESHIPTEEELQNDYYETQDMLNKYLHFNFGERDNHFFKVISAQVPLQGYEPFPVKVAHEALRIYKTQPCSNQKRLRSALDLGCGMGRTAFELARWIEKVDAIDYSHAFIREANRIKQDGHLKFSFTENGENKVHAQIQIDAEIDRQRLTFIQGDAMNLPIQIGPYDIIIACNLIDRLKNPMQCLVALHPLLKNDGILIIISPYTWLKQFTPIENWIGGKDGKPTSEALKEVMNSLSFDQIDENTLTLFIREHERKFEFILPHLTAWKKKPFCQEFATSIFSKKE